MKMSDTFISFLFMMISVTGYAQDEVSPEYIIVDQSAVDLNVNSSEQFQDKALIPAQRRRYTDGKTLARLHKFGYLFSTNEEASRTFRKYKTNRGLQIGGNIGLPVLFGYLSFAFLFSEDRSSGDLWLIGLGSIAFNNVVFGIAKGRHKQRLLSYTRDELLVRESKREPQLNLGLTQSGVGLVYKFR